MRIMFRHITHDNGFVAAAQVQILEPVFADEVAALLDNRLPIGNTHEDGRHEENGIDAFVVECA